MPNKTKGAMGAKVAMLTTQDIKIIGELLDKKLGVKISGIEKKMDDNFRELKGDIAQLQGDITQIKGDIAQLQGDIAQIKKDIAQLQLKFIRFERKFEERSSYWESFANGVDSFMGEIVESREDRTKTDKKLKGHEKRICVLEYAVLHAPKNKKKYGA